MSKRKADRLKDIKMNESGQYEYTGEYYKMDEEAGAAGLRRRIVILLIALAILVVASGLSKSEAATKAFYVILPYVGEVTSLFILAWGSISVLSGKDRVRAITLQSNQGKIIGGATLLSMFAMLGCLMAMVHIIRSGDIGGIADNIWYPALKFAAAVVAMNFKKTYTRIKWVLTE